MPHYEVLLPKVNYTDWHFILKARVMRVITALGYASEIGYQTYTANEYTTSQNQAGAAGGLIIS
jgi:hypothetical protein